MSVEVFLAMGTKAEVAGLGEVAGALEVDGSDSGISLQTSFAMRVPDE